MSLRLGSLFSGYGGLDLAVEEVFGARTVWNSDIEPGPRKVLAHRFPDVPNLGDITTVDWSQVEPVDIIAGGSPCQDISAAGRMAGMVHGSRSNLWVHMREAIRIIRPMSVVWENVGAARSTKAASASLPDHLENAIRHHQNVAQETRHAPTRTRHQRAAARLMERRQGLVGDHPEGVPVLRALGRVLGDLASLGYDASWRSLRAADIGAPHGRLRFFVVAANTAHVGHERPWPSRVGWAGPPDGGIGPVVLLPTPKASNNENRQSLDRYGMNLGQALGVTPLLPTPRATDGTKGGPNQRGSSGDLMLPSAVMQLLPTPSAGNFNDGEDPEQWEARRQRVRETAKNGNGMGMPLGIAVQLLPTPRATGGGSSTETVELNPPRSEGYASNLLDPGLPEPGQGSNVVQEALQEMAGERVSTDSAEGGSETQACIGSVLGDGNEDGLVLAVDWSEGQQVRAREVHADGQEHIGRRLSADEHVHHINGTKTDNRIENLHVCTRSEHALAHGSLAALLPELVGRGLVGFDPETGRYFLV